MIDERPSPLPPEHALAYLRELEPDVVEVAVVGPDGALLAGNDGRCAQAARSRQGAERVLVRTAGGYTIAAALPHADDALAAFDLDSVVSAIAVSFAV